MFRIIRAIEQLTAALNRFMDLWEAGSAQQTEVDGLTTALKRASVDTKTHLQKGA